MINDQNGFIALISVVIIVLILLGTTAALATSGFLHRFNILDGEAKEISAGYANACIEAARLKFVRDGADFTASSTAPLSVGEGECFISAVTPSGSSVVIEVKGMHERTGATTKYKATIDSDGNITAFKEI